MLKNYFEPVSGFRLGTKNVGFGALQARFETFNRSNNDFFNSLKPSRQLGE